MINYHSIKKHADSLANYLPGGILWVAKRIANTRLRQFLEGLSPTLQESEGFLQTYQDQFLPDNTTVFIEDWERAVGIPDDCLPVGDNIATRRASVILKLAGLAVQTQADFENIATLYGLNVNVLAGMDSGVVAPDSELRFTVVIEYIAAAPYIFPYTFPITFGDPNINILNCLYEKIRPANCQVIFIQL